MSTSATAWYSRPRKALLRQVNDDRRGGAGRAAMGLVGVVESAMGEALRRLRFQRTGGAYMKPPLLHRLLAPRGSFSALLGPTLRSKISP